MRQTKVKVQHTEAWNIAEVTLRGKFVINFCIKKEKNKSLKPVMVVHACNQEEKAGGSLEVEGQPR